MNKVNDDLTYQQALEELENIVEALEDETIPVDELAIKVKRASDLIEFCQAKLTETDEEVKKILTYLEDKTKK
ncbi:MAG: exodeoxyribonuclease VII small subunit [Bacteroidota bacterium]|uniref:Exodeoxyribonuclease 7 small subunit n=2 Tax=Adhaeribacter TaxID=299566 RepID=A0A7L7L6S5_9BACT|nr:MULTISPECIES: exodeoxyribonuclease VII small subunit [Adhaeribacter]MDQ4138916.1 exodeoxyribonuclease VII small subunit [Bacteroidota bacterium]PSR52965.1 exodeoxyribonuclease VII small subunit [Adhaeribacter arboris]QMU28454.1 exodeoxyribonuclease VII small subunit [Adhaeribacter radiodurans]